MGLNTEKDLSSLPAFMPGLYDLDEREYTATLITLAEWGDAKAQHNLGAMYLEGVELPMDYAAALRWHGLAAKQGFAPAQYDLGIMYLEGLGVDPDPVVAAAWFQAAANQNDSKAQNNLGILFATGEGVPQDMIQARKWFLLAVRGGLADAEENLAFSSEEMNPEAMAQAAQLANDWSCTHKTA